MKARKPGHPAQVNGNGKTAQSYIAGIGASGALLAGAVVSFVFLVGAVSFQVWPTAAGQGGGDDSLGVAELSGPGSGSSEPSLGEAVSLLAAAVPNDVVAPKGADKPNGSGDGGSDQGSGGDTGQGTGGGSVGGSDGSIADTPDDPDSGGNGGSGGGSNGPGGGSNGPGRDTGNTGTNGGGATTPGTTGTGTTGSSGGSGSGGSGGGGSNHSSR